ncbi:hypothetical protein [Saccharothrix texasensis]|uniref:hypothetical protein n=1 Tax=Saccharothrix texasensis TaxID=103734 RepID=UPI001FED230A|nr:hypothetical protein [Saccharothrix texasensis]
MSRKRTAFAPVIRRIAAAQERASAVLGNGRPRCSASLAVPDTVNPRNTTSRPCSSRKAPSATVTAEPSNHRSSGALHPTEGEGVSR